MKQAGFRVLVTAFMPAVLVEIGFGTNASEASYMTDPKRMEELSAAVADGVLEYLKRYERRVACRHRCRLDRGRSPAVTAGRSALQVQAAGLTFQNPIVLAAGTAAYGHELDDVVDLDRARRDRDEGREPRAARRVRRRRASPSSPAE